MKPEFTPFDVVGPALLKLNQRWRGIMLKEHELYDLINTAIAPSLTTTLNACFVKAPDYTVAVLALVRKIWSKDSKRQRLKNFIATTAATILGPIAGDARPEATGRNRDGRKWTIHTRTGWKPRRVEDKEIADTYNRKVGCHHHEVATVKDVEQARRALHNSRKV
jgi:hypothetical protein